MPIGDGCGWGSSVKNSSLTGLAKGLSNTITAPISALAGGLTSAVAYPFNVNYGKIGYDIAKWPQMDSNGVCYETCKENESMSWDGESCIDRNGKATPRVPTDIKNIQKHNMIDYLWGRDLRSKDGNPLYVDNITVAPPAGAPAAAAPAPEAAATGRRNSRKKCGRGKIRDRASKRCRRKKSKRHHKHKKSSRRA